MYKIWVKISKLQKNNNFPRNWIGWTFRTRPHFEEISRRLTQKRPITSFISAPDWGNDFLSTRKWQEIRNQRTRTKPETGRRKKGPDQRSADKAGSTVGNFRPSETRIFFGKLRTLSILGHGRKVRPPDNRDHFRRSLTLFYSGYAIRNSKNWIKLSLFEV